jgi:cysteinyl-tRNA synthetase
LAVDAGALAAVRDVVVEASDSTADELLAQVEAAKLRFAEQMDDDFNTAGAVAAVFDLISHSNTAIAAGAKSLEFRAAAKLAAAVIRELLLILGVDLSAADANTDELPIELLALAQQLVDYSGNSTAQAAELLLELRARARADKDWAVADAVRDGLTALGLIIEDTESGTRVFRA